MVQGSGFGGGAPAPSPGRLRGWARVLQVEAGSLHAGGQRLVTQSSKHTLSKAKQDPS